MCIRDRPYLASILSLTAVEIEEIKTEEEISRSQVKQALLMLRMWKLKEEANYGQLYERLKTVSLFQS